MRITELKARFAALEAEVVAAYEASDDWAVAGHRSVAAALSHRGRLPRAEANQTVHLARSLREMPVVSEALANAEISVCHARRLARASVRDGFADAEALLCEHARTLRYTAFDKAVSYWEHLADTDAAERDATFKEQRREFHASMTFEGMGRLDGWLDPVGFEEFNNALDRIEKELFQHDLKVGQIEHIDKHNVSLWRTPAQRRADALVEMARRATAMPPAPKPPNRWSSSIWTSQPSKPASTKPSACLPSTQTPLLPQPANPRGATPMVCVWVRRGDRVANQTCVDGFFVYARRGVR